MFCPQCGAENENQASFCQACGASTSNTAASNNSTMAQPKKEYGGFWLRFGAYMIDSLILGAAFYVIALFLFLTLGASSFLTAFEAGSFSEEDAIATFIILYLVLCIVSLIGSWLYFALMESSKTQATLGKKAVGVVVTDLDGNRISFGKATGRFFGKIVSGLVFNIGYIIAGFTEKKQALHDMMASTLVVKK